MAQAIDAVACEPQFVDHAAPIWLALPPEHRGTFYAEAALIPRAASYGIDARPVDAAAIRSSGPPPAARPGPGPRALVVSVGDTKVARRLGYRRFAFAEHGAGQAYIGQRGINGRHPSYSGGADREDTELFLVPNEYSADLWRRAYPGACVAVVGSPRLDALGRLSRPTAGEPPVVALSFHWPAYVAPEAGTALGHYGAVLPELARRFRLIGHAHPKGDWPDRMARVYRRAGIEFVRDFSEVVQRASLYVCDNSSTLFEFAALRRPVVVLNCPDYRRNVHHGLRFWDAAHVGLNCDQPGDLADTIERALIDPPEVRARREDALGIVYAYRSGAARRAADALVLWAHAD